ncbi:OmpH family outer membrane protein [Candidatus Bipolaricaulota bacterium]|nr:OmpH family outer membrane protein [Candidatus Bipolaricaulota bacterium]
MLLTTAVTAGAQGLSVAVVDTQEIFRVHPSFGEVQKELQEKQNEMRAELEELGEEEAKARQREMQRELQKLQQELVAEAVEEVNEEVGNMATKLGYDVVINLGGIISGRQELEAKDITKEILTEMEEKYDLDLS